MVLLTIWRWFYLALTPSKNKLFRKLEIIYIHQEQTDYTKQYTQCLGIIVNWENILKKSAVKLYLLIAEYFLKTHFFLTIYRHFLLLDLPLDIWPVELFSIFILMLILELKSKIWIQILHFGLVPGGLVSWWLFWCPGHVLYLLVSKGLNHLLHWTQISVKTWTEDLHLAGALMKHFLEGSAPLSIW